MSLYRIVEVPDPSGQLADMIEELLDNSALVVVDVDYAEAMDAWARHSHDAPNARVKAIINAALGIDPPEET